MMEQPNISPKLATVLETIVTALETSASNFVGEPTPAVNVTVAALDDSGRCRRAV